MMITAMLMDGTFLFISLWLQLVAGLTPFVAGQWLVPQMIAVIIGTQLARSWPAAYAPVCWSPSAC